MKLSSNYLLKFTKVNHEYTGSGWCADALGWVGVSVAATRTAAIVAGSALMGAADSFLTLSGFNAFFFNMVNGRG